MARARSVTWITAAAETALYGTIMAGLDRVAGYVSLGRAGVMAGHIQEAGFGERPFEHTGQIAQSVARGGFDAISSSADPQADGVTVEAAVKWFNATKGYGFVELSDGRRDAFLHLKTLREIGRQTLPSGAKVRVVARAGSRGSEVVRIVEVDTKSALERSPRRSAIDVSSAFELTGKVKWFDEARGFGFVASDDFGRDVFVHSTTLAACDISGVFEGQAVSMRVVETPKGREAIEIFV